MGEQSASHVELQIAEGIAWVVEVSASTAVSQLIMEAGVVSHILSPGSLINDLMKLERNALELLYINAKRVAMSHLAVGSVGGPNDGASSAQESSPD